MSSEEERSQEEKALLDDSLGELPRDLLRERGEIPWPRGRVKGGRPATSTSDIIPDDPNDPGKLGTVKQGSRVISTYDARPINGSDVVKGGETTVTVTGSSGDPPNPIEFADFTYTVPDGKVFVLRSFAFDIGTVYSGINYAVTVLVNGTSQNFENVPWPANAGDIPTFIIGDSGDEITVRVRVEITIAASSEDVTVNTRLYGNLLQSTARPKEEEVGTPIPPKAVSFEDEGKPQIRGEKPRQNKRRKR